MTRSDIPTNRGAALPPKFVDPLRHVPLRPGADGAALVEPESGAVYPISDGIADLVHPRPQQSDGPGPQFDRPLPAVDEAARKWIFRAFGVDETSLRDYVIDKLALTPDAVVLDNGCGMGASTRLLQQRLPHGVLCNTDISLEMLAHGAGQAAADAAQADAAQADAAEARCRTVWCGANALYLPFADNSFDAVLCTGGFNQFGNDKAAIDEMTRVTRIGGRIVIADEGFAPWLQQTLLGQMVINDNPLMSHGPPIAALPEVAQQVRVEWLLGNAYYCLEFRVGAAPPAVDLDLPHEGLRGGTIRSRYQAALLRRPPGTAP